MKITRDVNGKISRVEFEGEEGWGLSILGAFLLAALILLTALVAAC